jgi:hypothetical protein
MGYSESFSATAQFSHCLQNGLPAGYCPAVANALILFEWASGFYGADFSSHAVAFKEEPVPRLYAEELANLVRDCDLSLAGDSGLLLHGDCLLTSLYTSLLSLASGWCW